MCFIPGLFPKMKPKPTKWQPWWLVKNTSSKVEHLETFHKAQSLHPHSCPLSPSAQKTTHLLASPISFCKGPQIYQVA